MAQNLLLIIYVAAQGNTCDYHRLTNVQADFFMYVCRE